MLALVGFRTDVVGNILVCLLLRQLRLVAAEADGDSLGKRPAPRKSEGACQRTYRENSSSISKRLLSDGCRARLLSIRLK
jgi:hypothetical protein